MNERPGISRDLQRILLSVVLGGTFGGLTWVCSNNVYFGVTTWISVCILINVVTYKK